MPSRLVAYPSTEVPAWFCARYSITNSAPRRTTAGLNVPADSQPPPRGEIIGAGETRCHGVNGSPTDPAARNSPTEKRATANTFMTIRLYRLMVRPSVSIGIGERKRTLFRDRRGWLSAVGRGFLPAGSQRRCTRPDVPGAGFGRRRTAAPRIFDLPLWRSGALHSAASSSAAAHAPCAVSSGSDGTRPLVATHGQCSG